MRGLEDRGLRGYTRGLPRFLQVAPRGLASVSTARLSGRELGWPQQADGGSIGGRIVILDLSSDPTRWGLWPNLIAHWEHRVLTSKVVEAFIMSARSIN